MAKDLWSKLFPRSSEADAVRAAVAAVDAVTDCSPLDFYRRVDAEKQRLLRHCRPADVLTFKLHASRLLNLLVNKHEYRRSAVRKLGRPSGFMLDPANACQLGCPTCQHSWNKAHTAATYAPMAKGVMRDDTFEALMRELGPYAYVGHFYNNSEPFLHKHVCRMLGSANQFRINTLISSNLSLPKLDPEAIVSSGLNTLMVAIDGTTQEVYERYRRGGTLELVLHNVARIVEAKRRLGSLTPHLRWQFLTFEHNVHQVEEAIELARRIGFDSFNIATPFDVSGDDPGIHVAQHPRAADGESTLEFTKGPAENRWHRPLTPIADIIESAWDERLAARHRDRLDPWREPASAEPAMGHCDWLHLATIADAKGNVLPCCIPDYAAHGSFLFGSVESNRGDLYNSDSYLQARSLLSTGVVYPGLTEGTSRRSIRSKCAGCTNRPAAQVGLNAANVYLSTRTNEAYGTWIDSDTLSRLTGWSRHDHHWEPSPSSTDAKDRSTSAEDAADVSPVMARLPRYAIPIVGPLIEERDRLRRQRSLLIRERDRAADQHTRLSVERDALIEERNQLGELRYRFEHERDVVIAERDQALIKLRAHDDCGRE